MKSVHNMSQTVFFRLKRFLTACTHGGGNLRRAATTLILLTLVSCNFFDDKYVLDLSTSATFILGVSDTKTVSEFRFHAQGHSSANGVLELLLDDKVYKTQVITGDVDFKWTGDWYHPNMKIVYRVEQAGTGTLKIKYKLGHALL